MNRILLCLALLVSSFAAQAQEAWPARPVKFIVPSSPGGGTDVYARILAQALGESLKQQFIVENRPGASGNIGAAAAAKSAADGYTFLVSANPALAVNPSLYKELPYNAERDFTPVTRGVMAPMALVVHPSVPARTLAELIALGKTAPGKLAYGSAGTGSPTFLGVRMLEEGTGARFTHVPYKGVGAAYADLLGGQVQFLFPDVASAISHLKAGKLRALAVTQSTTLLPGTPTFAEAGFPLEVITSFSVVAPAGTPAPIIERLNAEMAAALAAPEVRERVLAAGVEPLTDTPQEFAAFIHAENRKWARVIKSAKIKVE